MGWSWNAAQVKYQALITFEDVRIPRFYVPPNLGQFRLIEQATDIFRNR